MKRYIAVLLAAFIITSFAACGTNEANMPPLSDTPNSELASPLNDTSSEQSQKTSDLENSDDASSKQSQETSNEKTQGVTSGLTLSGALEAAGAANEEDADSMDVKTDDYIMIVTRGSGVYYEHHKSGPPDEKPLTYTKYTTFYFDNTGRHTKTITKTVYGSTEQAEGDQAGGMMGTLHGNVHYQTYVVPDNMGGPGDRDRVAENAWGAMQDQGAQVYSKYSLTKND